MRRNLALALFFIIFQFPLQAFAWECLNEDKHGFPIEKNIALATDVIVGRVISGKLEEHEKIKFVVNISQVFKGKLKDRIELSTEIDQLYPEIVLGEKYLFMLYGNNEIDFCTPIFRLSSTALNYFRIPSDESIPQASTLSDKEYKDLETIYKYFKKRP